VISERGTVAWYSLRGRQAGPASGYSAAAALASTATSVARWTRM
jgi:hypothetical protein